MLKLIRNTARAIVFGPPKRKPKTVAYREAKARTTAQLKRELTQVPLERAIRNAEARRLGEEAIADALGVAG